jgi:tetratricopeptide (TPR) repeat protein
MADNGRAVIAADGTGAMNRRLEDRCAELTAEAEALRQAGRLDEALPRFTEALDIAARLAGANPADHRPAQQRASILYSLGSLHYARDHYAEAIAALDECERIYQDLGSRGVVDAGRLIADVKARRGRAKMAQGRGVSAVLELDEAVVSYRVLFTGDGNDENALDLARVLTFNAEAQFVCGDPDAAVASADNAIRLYLNRALAANNDPRGSFMHAGYFRQAADMAAEIHGIYGRFEPAVAADEMVIEMLRPNAAPGVSAAGRQALAMALTRKAIHLRATGEPGHRREIAALTAESSVLDAAAGGLKAQVWEHTRAAGMQVTLAEALALADRVLGQGRVRPELLEVVTAPALNGTIMSPSDRCAPQLGAAWGSELGGLARDLLPSFPREGLRIGVEAHCLFAVCARENPPYLRHQFAEFGVPWAQLLLACCKSLAAMDDQAWALPLALDLTGWNRGILLNLQPWVVLWERGTPPGPLPAGGVNVAELARECFIQAAELHEADGDQAGARQLRELAASIGQPQ